jgi:septum site-determining protein MinC
MGDGIVVKGGREGLTLILSPELSLQELSTVLQEKLLKESTFFQNAELVLDFGARPFQEKEFSAFLGILHSAGIRIKGILSDNPITKLMAKEAGIELIGNGSIMSSRVRIDHPVKSGGKILKEKPEEVHASALFVRKTLRSGQLQHFNGDLTILGDVNPGAEVSAAGNIVVFGSLRGIAHAGIRGDQTAVVAALELKPTQLRIADCIARSSEEWNEDHVPEMAKIERGSIVIEPYALKHKVLRSLL